MQRIRKKLKLSLIFVLIVTSMVLASCVGFGAAQAGWSGVVTGNDSLYVGSADGKLVSLNAENGFHQWQESLDTGAAPGGLGCAPATGTMIYSTPAFYENNVYLGDYSGRLHVLSVIDRQSKTVRLNDQESKPIIGSPIVSHENVYIASTNGSLYAYDAGSLNFQWSFSTGDEIWSTPAVWEDSVIIGSFDKKVYSVDALSGEANWGTPFETKGPVIASPVVYGDTVFVASLDRSVYALDASSGELIWQFPPSPEYENAPERWLWATPVVHDGTVYAPGMDGRVYAINAESGTLIEAIDITQPIASKPVIAGDRLVIATEQGRIYSIDTETFQSVELRNLDTEINAPLGVDGNTVYVHSTQKNEVYAVNGETGALFWSTSMN